MRAQSDQPVTLDWNAPADCASAEDVLDRVRRLTKSARLSDRQLRAQATITPLDHGRLHLQLMLRAGQLVGERNIDGRSCDDLAGATAVILALLLRSTVPLSGDVLEGSPTTTVSVGTPPAGSAADGGEARDGTAQPVAPNTERGSDAQREASDADHTNRRWRGLLQLPLVSLGIGPVSRASAGFGLALGARFERWSFVAEGTYWLPDQLSSSDQPDAGAELQRIEAGVRSCRAFPFGQFELAPCGRVAVQQLWARGFGTDVTPQTARATWAVIGVGAQARYHFIQWFSVFGGVDAQLQTARPALAIEDLGSLGQLWPAALTLTLGVEWIL
ncbi:MAG TPA: hypothetical protein VFZ61_17370 [Polyangiales bacterium]